MLSKETIGRLDIVAGNLTKGLAYIGAYFIFFLMLLIALHVLTRYLFDMPIPGAVDLIQFAMVIIVFLGFGQVAHTRANITVEVIMTRLPWAIQRIAAILVNTLGIIFLSLIVWQNAIQTVSLKSSNQISGVLHIPHYPFYIVLVVGYFIFVLAIIVEILKLITGALKK